LKRLKFSHDYTKLSDRIFTTIRKGEPLFYAGDEVECRTPTRTFQATCLLTSETDWGLASLDSQLLMYDSEKPSVKEAFALFQSFYRKPLSSAKYWTVYLLKSVEV